MKFIGKFSCKRRLDVNSLLLTLKENGVNLRELDNWLVKCFKTKYVYDLELLNIVLYVIYLLRLDKFCSEYKATLTIGKKSGDIEYRRYKYVRLLSQVLVGVIGSIDDMDKYEESIRAFLESRLNLSLVGKTWENTVGSSFKFLSYIFRKGDSVLRDKKDSDVKQRYLSYLKVLVRIMEVLRGLSAGGICKKQDGRYVGCKLPWLAKAGGPDFVVKIYNNMWNYFRSYYKLVQILSSLETVRLLLEESCSLTIKSKEFDFRKSVSKESKRDRCMVPGTKYITDLKEFYTGKK